MFKSFQGTGKGLTSRFNVCSEDMVWVRQLFAGIKPHYKGPTASVSTNRELRDSGMLTRLFSVYMDGCMKGFKARVSK